MELNEKDLKILAKLKENSKCTVSQISSLTDIPITTVHNRIKRMERQGVIKRYSLELNHAHIGNALSAYVQINTHTMLPNGLKVSQDDIAKQIRALDKVEKVETVAGGADILAIVRVKDTAELNGTVLKELRKIDGVDKIHTLVVLSEY